ncbi:hypothetical protein N5C81_29545 [Rhizobium pusense]|uniref:hypothetical protein n=1 Tax=Agrobacterium pusense TaxID=648995 RepID=UPI002449661D|nr:hypothetical protein [Agrobacterium pusense]MDH1271726.1 hypothetical protein [Agrobacterium pusense]
MTGRTKPGHNGGPPLDEPVDRRSGQCKHCVHWDAPPENEQRAYEWFRLGLSRSRVKRPSGTCDRVLLPGRKSTVFSATAAEFGCLNFEAKPLPARSAGGGFVTIWRNGRIAWQGAEENVPPRFLQDMLDLEPPGDGGPSDDGS